MLSDVLESMQFSILQVTACGQKLKILDGISVRSFFHLTLVVFLGLKKHHESIIYIINTLTLLK